MGLYNVPFHDKTGVGHNGGIDSFASQAYYFKKGNLVIVNLTNALDLPLNDILTETLNAFYNLPIKIPNFPDKIYVPVSTLQKYTGFYKSEDIPFELTITTQDGLLYGQSTGQPAFTITPISQIEFEFRRAGAKFTFDINNKAMTLEQGGRTFKYQKN